jgi:hypothetical protein
VEHRSKTNLTGATLALAGVICVSVVTSTIVGGASQLTSIGIVAGGPGAIDSQSMGTPFKVLVPVEQGTRAQKRPICLSLVRVRRATPEDPNYERSDLREHL